MLQLLRNASEQADGCGKQLDVLENHILIVFITALCLFFSLVYSLRILLCKDDFENGYTYLIICFDFNEY